MYLILREIRNEKGITAREMADALGLKTDAAYYKKESGLIKISLEEAKIIADKLEMSIDKIFFDQNVSIIETNATA